MVSHQEIKNILPHRYPMLLVDSILFLQPGKEIRVIKNVTGTESCYSKLAASAPKSAYEYPSSLMIESFCQAAGILYGAAFEEMVGIDRVLLFGSITRFRFHAGAYPGDTLVHHVRVEKQLSDSAMFSGETLVGNRMVAEVERLVVAVRPRAQFKSSPAPLDLW